MTLAGQRGDLLASYGATGPEAEELLAYNSNVFDRSVGGAPALPLPAEPHAAAWGRYVREAAGVGAPAALRRRLAQLRFPIRADYVALQRCQGAPRKLGCFRSERIPPGAV